MLWLRTEDWQVFLHERGGWACADALNAPLTATSTDALGAWQSLAARIPRHARVSVWLSAGVAPVLRVKGEVRLREPDWFKLAVIQQFGAESSPQSVVALNQHDDPAVRIACVADGDLIRNITQSGLRIRLIASWPLALLSQWQDKTEHNNVVPALIAVADQDAWTLAALNQDGCQALLSMPTQVPADQIERELQRLAVSLAWTGVQSHVLPRRLPANITSRFKNSACPVARLSFATPSSKALRTGFAALLLLWIVSLAALLQVANSIQYFGKENQFRIQKIASISIASSRSTDLVVTQKNSDAKREEWLALLNDSQRVSSAVPDVQVGDFSFDESGQSGRATLRVPLAKKADFDEMCLPMLEIQAWQVVSVRTVVDPVYKKVFDVSVEYRRRVPINSAR